MILLIFNNWGGHGAAYCIQRICGSGGGNGNRALCLYAPVPLMMTAGQLTLTSAGLVAAMNYLGYLVGAWDAMRAHRFVETRLWLGIFGAVALTLLSAAADNAIVHGLLRFAIGCMSGWSMVLIAAWTNERLGQLGKPGLSAAVFAGPGAGIALSGLLAVCIQAKSLSAGAAWQIYGVLALVLVALVARYLPRAGQLHRLEPRRNLSF